MLKRDSLSQIMCYTCHYVEKIVVLGPKTYCYLTNDYDENKKKAKCTKKWIINRELEFEDYKKYQDANQLKN